MSKFHNPRLNVVATAVLLGFAFSLAPQPSSSVIALATDPNGAVRDIDGYFDLQCVLTSNKLIYCWNLSDDGEVIVNGRLSPTQEPTNANDWEKLSVGAQVCAIKSNGSLYCWGPSLIFDAAAPAPVRVGSQSDWMQVSVGSHVCAINSTDELYCWGKNNAVVGPGLGLGDYIDREYPTQVRSDLSWRTVSAGSGSTCAITIENALYCWGREENIGLGEGVGNRTSPAQVGTDLDWESVSVGTWHTCAIKVDHKLFCWGYNRWGQLGIGPMASYLPTRVGSGVSWKTVFSGHVTSCGIRLDQSLYCWGPREWLGIGDSASNYADTRVGSASNWINATGTGCAANSDGELYCWGYNDFPARRVITLPSGLNQAPSMQSLPVVGSTVNASVGKWFGTPNPALTLQWYLCSKAGPATSVVPRDCTAKGMPSTLEFTPVASHQGKYLRLLVSAVNPYGTASLLSKSEIVLSRATATVKPTVRGTTTVGKTLAAVKGTWTGYPTPTYTYTWYACTSTISAPTSTVPGTCATISGATSSTFKLTATQRGKYIAVLVTGTSAGTSATAWLSKTTAIVK